MLRRLNTKGEDSRADSAIGQVLEQAQDEKFEFGTEAYTLATLAERETRYSLVGGTMYLYTRKDDTIYRVALTAV